MKEIIFSIGMDWQDEFVIGKTGRLHLKKQSGPLKKLDGRACTIVGIDVYKNFVVQVKLHRDLVVVSREECKLDKPWKPWRGSSRYRFSRHNPPSLQRHDRRCRFRRVAPEKRAA